MFDTTYENYIIIVPLFLTEDRQRSYRKKVRCKEMDKYANANIDKRCDLYCIFSEYKYNNKYYNYVQQSFLYRQIV